MTWWNPTKKVCKTFRQAADLSAAPEIVRPSAPMSLMDLCECCYATVQGRKIIAS